METFILCQEVLVLLRGHALDAILLDFGGIDFGYREIAKEGV